MLFEAQQTYAQTVEFINPFVTESNDTIEKIKVVTTWNRKYFVIDNAEKTLFWGADVTNLRQASLRGLFLTGFDSSKVKAQIDSSYDTVGWDQVYLRFSGFVLNDGTIGISGLFAVKALKEGFEVPVYRNFVIFLNQFTVFQTIKFIEFASDTERPVVQTVFSSLFDSGKIYLFSEVEYNEPSSSPTFIVLNADNGFPQSVFPYRNITKGTLGSNFFGSRYSYTIRSDSTLIPLYSTGHQVINLEKGLELYRISDSLEISSPIFYFKGEPCVYTIQPDLKNMKNIRFGYWSFRKSAVVHEFSRGEMPYEFIVPLDEPFGDNGYFGIKLKDGIVHLVKFIP